MNKKTYYLVISVIFAIVGLLHLARIFYGWEATLGDVPIPLWVSYPAFVIAGYLSLRGWQFAKQGK